MGNECIFPGKEVMGGLDLRSYKNAVPRKRPGLALPLLREGIVTRSRPVQDVFNVQLLPENTLGPGIYNNHYIPIYRWCIPLSALHLQFQSGYNCFYLSYF